MAWNDATTPYFIPAGEKYLKPLTIVVDPKGGNVQIQVQDSAGTWFTPAAAEYTVTTAGPVRLAQANTPPMRVIATAAAQFEVTRD